MSMMDIHNSSIPSEGTLGVDITELTPVEKAILKILACKGPKTYYELYAREGAGSRGAVNQALKRLAKKRLIEIKRKEPSRSGLEKKYYGLTFLGLHIVIVLGFIKPEQGYQIMARDNIQIPKYRINMGELIEKIVEEFPSPIAYAIVKPLKKLSPNILFNVTEEVAKTYPKDFFSCISRIIDLRKIKDMKEYVGYVTLVASSLLTTGFWSHKYDLSDSKELEKLASKIWKAYPPAFRKKLKELYRIVHENMSKL